MLLSLSAGLTLTMVQWVMPSSSQAGELSVIQRRGGLIVAVKDNLRPLGFRGADGQLVGLEIDLARRLAAEILGNEAAIDLQPVSNEERLSVLLNGNVDLVIARVTQTGSRARLVDFSTPYYLDGTALITRDGAVRQLNDLVGQRIAVLNGSDTIATLRSLLPNITLVGVDSYQAALDALESGQAIAFAGDASVLSGWVQEYPQYRLLPDLLSTEALCVVMPRGNQYATLRRQVNEAIDRWRANGWLQERIEYWGLPQ